MTGKGTDARKRLLEEHAKEVFAAKGYSGASISQIVKQAGVARSTFYQYFDNKLHLFESILDSFLQDLHGSVRPVTLGTGDPSPMDQISNNLTGVLDLVLGERALTRILLAHPGQIDSTVEGRLNCFYEEVHGMIQRSLNLGITMRLVRTCSDPIARGWDPGQPSGPDDRYWQPRDTRKSKEPEPGGTLG